MGANTSVRIAAILDGTSNTVMLSELRAGISEADNRGVWALSGGGSSSTWGHGSRWINWVNGPNSPGGGVNGNGGDDIEGCDHVMITYTGTATPNRAQFAVIEQMGMPCSWSLNYANVKTGSRGMHTDGVYVCFADGSVHWISDYVELGVGGDGQSSVGWHPGVWDLLYTSADEHVIEANKF